MCVCLCVSVCLHLCCLMNRDGWDVGSCFSRWDIHLKRLLCLGVRVIDILPASLSSHIFSVFFFFALLILDIPSLLNCFFISVFFFLSKSVFFPYVQLVSSDTPAAEPPVAVVSPVETTAQSSPPPPPLPPPPAERTGGIGDSRPPSFQ